MILAVAPRCLLSAWGLGLAAGLASASPVADHAALRLAAASHVETVAQVAFPDAQVQVEIGPIDPRLTLSPCPSPRFTLPAGAPPWGPGNLSVACQTPQSWSLFLSYRISLRGPAWLARHPLPTGHVPRLDDLTPGEIEYVGDPGRYLRDPTRLAGAALARPLAEGRPLTLDVLRVRPLVRAGQKIRVVVQGPAFQVTQEAVARGQAGLGERVRLKTPSGRVIEGVVEADGSVRVKP